MRISVKIFGVAVIVLAIMSLASFYTLQKLYKINHELKDIAYVFVPLAGRLAHIQVQILEEGQHVERLEKMQVEIALIRARAEIAKVQSGKDEGVSLPLSESETTMEVTSPDRARNLETTAQRRYDLAELKELVAREYAELEARTQEVDEAIRVSEEIVIEAQKRVSSLEKRLLLAELLPRLKAIEQQHQSYHTQTLLLAEAFKIESPIVAQLEAQMAAEEQELAKYMQETWDKVEHFTEQATLTAEKHEREAFYASMVLTGTAGILALVLSFFVIRGLVHPIRELLAGAERVEKGELDIRLQPHSSDEIGALTDQFNLMVDGLRAKEKIKATFGQYVDPRIVAGLLENHATIASGEKKVVTVYFSDLAGFSALSEQFTASGLVKVLNRYLDIMSGSIRANSGVIDKYIGDAIMAFWTEPFCSESEQANLAVRSALANSELLGHFQKEMPDLIGLRQNVPTISQRIGIATGEAIVGSIGSDVAKNYTALGDTVNLGARLEGANKVYGTKILVCARTSSMASGLEFRHVDRVVVVGKTVATDIYEPLGTSGVVAPNILEARDVFEAGLSAYFNADWSAARDKMSSVLGLNQNDPVAAVFLRRLDGILEKGVPEDWNGSWHLTDK